MQVLAAYVPSIWSQLYRHTECEEEGTRNVVAECLGKLCLIRPDELLPKLQVKYKFFVEGTYDLCYMSDIKTADYLGSSSKWTNITAIVQICFQCVFLTFT